MLRTEFGRIQEMLGSVSALSWVAINVNGDLLDMIQASTDTDLKNYVTELAKALSAWTQPEDMAAASSFYEIYAEAITLHQLKIRAANKGFTIRRTPAPTTSGVKTPDFECDSNFGRFYVEVKTPDIAGGVFATGDIMREALDNRIELESRIRPGVTWSKPQVISPYGAEIGRGLYSDIIEVFTKKILNNVKKDQVTFGPTILLVYDGRLSLDTRHQTCLVPSYFYEALKPTPEWPGECVSGDWWHVGFGRVGNQFLTRSEFEGKGNLGGQLKTDGILVEHPYLLGLAIMSGGKWSQPDPTIYTLAQTTRRNLPEGESFEQIDAACAADLISDAYNDSSNGNGCRYQLRR